MTASATALPATPAWLDRWAAFASGLQFADLPAAVVARSRQVLFDSVGAIAAGAQEAETRALTERLAALGGTGGFAAPVIGAHRRLPAGTAAFLNGTAGTMLEIDEGNQFARGHPGIHVVPAALAAAERLGSSGADLITALALGYEIGARIGPRPVHAHTESTGRALTTEASTGPVTRPGRAHTQAPHGCKVSNEQGPWG